MQKYVLILIVVDDGIVLDMRVFKTAVDFGVLILIVVDDGLVPLLTLQK